MPNFVEYKTFRENSRLPSVGADTPTAPAIKKDYLLKAMPPEADNRIVTFTASTGVVDRMGDVIHQSGWKIDNFLKNPVVLFGHESHRLPVGHAVSVTFDNGNLTLAIDFVPREIDVFADTVFQMVKRGDLRAGSVGMQPMKWKWVETEERFGIDFIEQELLEFSIVTIPANPEALNIDNKAVEDVETIDIETGVEADIKNVFKPNIKRMQNRLQLLKNKNWRCSK